MNKPMDGPRADATLDGKTGRLLDEWLQDEAPRHEPPLLVPTALARIALTRRRPAWLIRDWWLWRPRRDKDRGFLEMNSAMRLIAVMALVAGGAGLYVVAGGTDGDVQPAAQSAPLEPSEVIAAVTGSAGQGRNTETAELTLGDYAFEYRGDRWEGELTLSDPRISGQMWSVHDYDLFVRSGNATVVVGSMGIENDEGSWHGTLRGFVEPEERLFHYNALLSGSDAYEGLSAMLIWTDHKGSSWDINGIIFPGELPDYPGID